MSKTTVTPKRITRSISFETVLLNYVKARAKKEKRTPNWIINDLVRKELAGSK